MRLHPLLSRLQANPSFQAILEQLRDAPDESGHHRVLLSAISPARPFILAALHAALQRPMLLVVPRPSDARRFADSLTPWLPDPVVLCLFPETDALPYDFAPNDPDKVADRLGALRRLVAPTAEAPPLVVACARAAMDLLVPSATLGAHLQHLQRGQTISPTALAEEWLRLGYQPSPLVDQPGLFTRRGGILDVFPPGGQPVRVEFWGDEIDTIRTFDAESQRTVAQLEEAVVGPAQEVLPAPIEPLDLREVRPSFQASFERHQRFLEDRQAFPLLDSYRGLLGSATLLDYLGEDAVLVLDEPDAITTAAREFEQQVEALHADLLERGEVPRGLPRPYRPWAEIETSLAARRLRRVLGHFNPDTPTLPFQHARKFGGRLDSLIDDLTAKAAAKRRTVIVSQQTGRLHEIFQEHALAAPELDEVPADLGRLTLIHGLLREGWASDALGTELLTDGELFGWMKQARAPARKRADHAAAARERFLAELKAGDLVVHEDHGIGRFRGLVRTAIGFAPGTDARARQAPPGQAEFLLLEYAASDRLYVPLWQADRVARYVGAGDAQPNLTRLGSGEWAGAKARVRRSVRDIARELMELYAARQAVVGHPFSQDAEWQRELESSFPFEETPDQLQALTEVKQDMERERPMDRLLVGDVGFGKTEIALRAAFKAVQDGCQVAMLVPTTVLAQQHFNTFLERLAPFPVRTEMLSRFRTDKEQRAVLRGLEDGSVDVCIGTHRLVQKDVRFKSLGLVIIDEEQRFGVAHKERLKQLRREVDVLTLTATPIPRTLHMGLVGVRDLSVLETPPEARLPVRTYVAEYDEGTVREAILREIDRGGQVYFVHNRVNGIETLTNRLRKLLPDARIGVGHGQMPEEQLEQTMLAFANGEYDVLVCTTIIESGLDIPNANTIVVNNAHRFGLAQLYQLRGRVGRGTARAYAYFFYTRDLTLTSVAAERLKTIFEATELGAGMRIAMKDLEIRGAGNLLGAEQSGQIASVGFDLYTKLLAEQVDLLRAHESGSLDGSVAGTRRDVSLDLPLSGFIPPELVPDDETRLRLYQRFAVIAGDDELAELVAELEDRFGKLPEPAQNMVYLTSLRLRALEADVRRIEAADGEVVVRFDTLPRVDVRALARTAGVPLSSGSNQIRLPRGSDGTWMGPLYTLVEALSGNNGAGSPRNSTLKASR